MKSFILCDLLALVSATCSGNSSQTHTYYEDASCRGKVGTELIKSTMKEVSRMECVLACDRDAQCMLVFYNKVEEECFVHAFPLDDIRLTDHQNSTCFRPVGLLEYWITHVIASSVHLWAYTTNYIMGGRDLFPWIPLPNTTAFVEVEIEVEIFIERIFIYELGDTAVAFSDISLRDPDENWVSVWSSSQMPDPSRDSTVEVRMTNFKTKTLRFDIYRVPTRQMIDCVRVVGRLFRPTSN